MPTKIQINSLKALERLIGGDTELEVELRKNVAVELIKKRIDFKAKEMEQLICSYTDATIRRTIKEVTQTFEKRLEAPIILPQGDTFRHTTMLQEEVQKACYHAFHEALEKMIPEVVAGIVDHYTKNKYAAVMYAFKHKIDHALKEALDGLSKQAT